MRQQFARHDRAGVEADRAARHEIAPAQRDEIGRARSGADEMHRHGAASGRRQRAGGGADHNARHHQLRGRTTGRQRRASATDPTPISATTRCECVWRGLPALSRSACATRMRRSPRAAPPPRCRARRLYCRGRDNVERRPGKPARASAAAITVSIAAAEVPRRHPMPATIMASPIAIGSPAWRAANSCCSSCCRPASARAIAMRINSPPSAHGARAAAPRSQGGGIDHQPAAGAQRRTRHRARRLAGAAAHEDGVRRRQAGERGRRRALHVSSPGTPKLAALRRCAPRARHAPRSRWRASTSASIHSIATDPAPAPMSHSNSPRRGASDDSVTARISRLVIWPSCSNRASGKPGGARDDAGTRRRHHLDRHRVERIDHAEIEARVVARMRSRGPPSASSTVRRDAPKPVRRASRRARGPSPSDVSASTRAPGCRCGRTRSSARPCSETSAQSASAQPSRAAARLKADGAGTTMVSAGSTWRASTAPTP